MGWRGAPARDLAEGARNHDLELSVGYLFAEDVAAARLNAAGLTTQPVGIGGLTDPRALPASDATWPRSGPTSCTRISNTPIFSAASQPGRWASPLLRRSTSWSLVKPGAIGLVPA